MYSQSPFLVESPALNLNCLFCPFPLNCSLLSGVREGDRLWALNYPCSTLTLEPLKQCGWTDFHECDDGLTCRNPLSLISPRPSAPSPSLFYSLAAPISPPRFTHTHTHADTLTEAHPLREAWPQKYKHAHTHLLCICVAFIRLGLNSFCCCVASLPSQRRSTEQTFHRCLLSISCSSWHLKIDWCPFTIVCHYFFICAEIVSLAFFGRNPFYFWTTQAVSEEDPQSGDMKIVWQVEDSVYWLYFWWFGRDFSFEKTAQHILFHPAENGLTVCDLTCRQKQT